MEHGVESLALGHLYIHGVIKGIIVIADARSPFGTVTSVLITKHEVQCSNFLNILLK